MDDDKTIGTTTYRLTIAGEEYEFGNPDPEIFSRMILVNHMNVGGLLTMDAVTKWLASEAGDRWQVIMKRFIDGEVSPSDLLKAMEDLVKAIAGDAAADAA